MACNSTFRYSIRILILVLLVLPFSFSAKTQNAIVLENQNAGNPQSEWDLSDLELAGTSILGFSTDISYNSGTTVDFKIDVPSLASYTVKIYRLGFYGGNGSRLITTLGPFTGVDQPDGAYDPVTKLYDCANWAVSASWNSSLATSGLYVARLDRTGGGASLIPFVIRDDAGTSDLYFQTSDATWQAYNDYGTTGAGSSLYPASAGGQATKVSYNRPIISRAGTGGGAFRANSFMDAEYPMIRWLEANGYDVSYVANADIARMGTNMILQHKAFLSVGHDAYWSKEMRDNVDAARAAGVHLAFFSGQEVYWKTRWEDSYRTLVCYKEGTQGEDVCGSKCDPSLTEWTGLWRTGQAYDAPFPENELTGQIGHQASTTSLLVPDYYKNLRFWRNTITVSALTSGNTATLGQNSIGFEFDYEQYPASYPRGRILMSSTMTGGRNHKLSLYKHSSGALVFGAGTVQWAWGLDQNHDRSIGEGANFDMQQATVNLFADMGAQPETIQPGLILATASTDVTAPTAAVTNPIDGATLPAGQPVEISGTASDVGGVVAGVEISFDGGTTWEVVTSSQPDVNATWTYTWVPSTPGAATVLSRGFDDSGNIGAASTVVNVTIGSLQCPCSLFLPTEGPAAPAEIVIDDAPVELGVRFESSVNGFITAIKFYKATDDGVITLNLYNTTTLVQLATVTYTGPTGSGWRQATLPTPVAITANTSYTVSYHLTGDDYAATPGYFVSPLQRGVLKAYGTSSPDFIDNGVYSYSATPGGMPINSFASSNYWADIVFVTSVTPTPVSLTNFVVAVEKNDARLNWETSSEHQNKGFEIERSIDGGTWSTIGFVNGAGESNELRKYSFLDKNLAPDVYYYRLRQLDNDGQFTYSKIITAIVEGSSGIVLYQNYPNPFSASTTIKFYLPENAAMNLVLYDVSGRPVKQIASGTRAKGTHYINFNSKGMQAGVYYYKLTIGEKAGFVKKMIIKY